ncbi:hypothetical protein FIBSPDRAFT_1044937 [Athelia psychrophila]|uniref:DUF6533 domain-containing protein n=1 Tax=Athelia psychrophila TaxID=1759441 RepID=A0A166IY38_9AGAM|nr:hypothetical protein FIBSPDRAFT_1044937 [Fibularhizoctonia sp. CBS 109695]
MASSTSLVYLPAIDPLAFQATTYVSVAQLTAYLYDWLLSIPEENEVVSRAGVTWPIAIYLLSRITTAAHLLLLVIFTFAPARPCTPLILLLVVCAITRTISTSLLFVLRVQAVYMGARPITTLFVILWLITAILNTLNDASVRAGPLTDPQYCTNYKMRYPTYPSISSFVFDTLVFIAVSYRLAADAAIDQSWRARLQSVVTGKGLFRISRALMISGQLYYLAIIMSFWVNLAVMLSPLIHAGFHYVLNTPYMVFTNIMACRVFRGVALGMLETSPTTDAGLSSTRIAAAFEAVPLEDLYPRDWNNQYPPSSAAED